MSNLKPWRRI